MSFETTVGFLTSAALYGEYDDLKSPASQIVLGKAVSHGSGAFDVLAQFLDGSQDEEMED
jgi:DNA-directed RNA polymerase I subunit RPA1